MELTTRQEILEYDRRFTIHSLQSLLETLRDLGELGHMFIEHLRVLARDGLEHSRMAASFRRESPYRRFMCGLFIHSLVRSAGRSGNTNKGGDRNGKRSRE